MTQFEYMPNELCLKVFSYFNTPDLFRSFSNLNIRFDGLLYASTEQVQLPENTQFPWLVRWIPQIESNIQKILLSEKYLKFHSFKHNSVGHKKAHYCHVTVKYCRNYAQCDYFKSIVKLFTQQIVFFLHTLGRRKK